MRLSTARDRDEARAIAVIHAALDTGVTLLDTADTYCHDEHDIGHNERLLATALRQWQGDRTKLIVATKGGLRRPKGAWVNDGRAKHLRAACDASRRALGVEAIDLYQLHAVNPATPLDTSVRALAALRKEGAVREIGLCNATVSQIEAARSRADITSIQVNLSVLDDTSLRNGVAEYARDNGLRLIAYRPLGGDRRSQLARDPLLTRLAVEHEVTPEDIALAWLLSFGDFVVPIPGATRVETARAVSRALAVHLEESELQGLDERYSGRLLRSPRARRRPSRDATGDVVLVMGMPGAGKSNAARELVAQGYERLNRDERGGSLSDLVGVLAAGLASGRRRWVLDNTYATRASRNEVVECAWAHGANVRCIYLTTPIADAQVNAIERLIEVHGRLPMPEDIRRMQRTDPRYLGPDAQFRFERVVEPPVEDEGFTEVETRPFVRQPVPGRTHRALVFDLDDLLGGANRGTHTPPAIAVSAHRHEVLASHARDGWVIFAHAWRPPGRQIASTRDPSSDDFDDEVAQARVQLGVTLSIARCSHAAGPPVCWCRKPLPGLLLEFAMREGVSLERSVVIGTSAADRTMASRLGMGFRESQEFFGEG